MIEHEVNWQRADVSPEKRVTRKGRLRIDLPINSFETAFVNFNNASEAFVASLTDSLHRRFAYRYLEYLQDIARGSDRLKPSTNRQPNWRLIGYELERLFKSYFFRPDQPVTQQC